MATSQAQLFQARQRLVKGTTRLVWLVSFNVFTTLLMLLLDVLDDRLHQLIVFASALLLFQIAINLPLAMISRRRSLLQLRSTSEPAMEGKSFLEETDAYDA